ncbi:Signal recognition particle 19 kDa protein [Methanococcoides methylutens MM1]|uniref:Signal recognition particle 19 kDa protein n=2 Tax=Methanococcoides TaxID=2225 RepID=A0A0E3SP80_METMT|nr:Signal recognition particle 19 kDa protein [Methanococcoides methylutens MM1]
MMMRDKGKLVIWPANLDRSRSRRDGRIISRKSSVENPELREISKAAEKLNLHPEVEADKKYPRSWWEASGRVLVDNEEPKTMVARKLAKAIKEARGG